MESVIALDVGGTSVKSGVVVDGRLAGGVNRRGLDEGAPADELVDVFAGVVRDRLGDAGQRVAAVAVAFPAPFDYAAGVPRLRHKFAALYRVDLGAALRARLGQPVLRVGFVNDAEAAVMGEAVDGAGKGASRVLGLTLGTGLGAALVVDGAVVGEAAGVVVGDLYRADVDGRSVDDRFSARGLASELGLDPAAELEQVADAARAGGRAERVGFERFGAGVGAFVATLVGRLHPDLVVIGGGLSAAFDLFGGPLQGALPIPVAPGALGPSAALVGAARLVTTTAV